MSAVEQLRAAQDRDVRLVGVPMFVVLRDETTQPPTEQGPADGPVAAPALAPSPGAAGADAGADPLAAQLDELWAALAPTQRDGDLGVVASLLGLAAHLDLRSASTSGRQAK